MILDLACYNATDVSKRLVQLLGVVVLAGCSPEAYRDSADLQVNQLIADRQNATLGYTPQVEVATEIPPSPGRPAFSKIPVTPLPPPAAPPLELRHAEVSIDPLGPDIRWSMPKAKEQSLVPPEAYEPRFREDMRLGPPLPDDKRTRLDMFGVLGYAVEHGPRYRDQMDSLYLSALDVTLERHLFSPRPFVGQTFRVNGNQNDYRAALTATTSAGVRQQLPYGGEVVAQTLVDFVQAVNGNVTEGESARLALSGSIPLLRGAGMVNLEPLIAGERSLIYQVRSFETFRRSFVVDIATQYFRLLQLQQAVINRRLNLANLAALTNRAEALYDNNRLSFLEVQRSLQSQITAENSLINAEEAYRIALDNFKLTIGMPIEEPLDIVAVELDVVMPSIDPEEAVRLAHHYRLDLRTAADQIEDAQRRVKNAEQGLRSDLELFADTTFRSSADESATHFDRHDQDYNAGIRLDLPVDRVSERNAFRRSLISHQRTQRDFVLQRDRVSNEVREALRGIRNADLSLQIQRRGITLAQNRLEFANDLLRQGKVNTRDLVEAQTSLLDAQDAYEQARSNLQIRILQYLRDTGTLRVDPDAGAIGQAMNPPAISVSAP